MSEKFTPGPWEFDPNGGLPVIQIYCPDGKNPFHGHRSEEECAANARLMAAAPELLEALTILVDNVTHAMPSAANLGPIVNARAAIAKATAE